MYPEVIRTKNFREDAVALINASARQALSARHHFRIALCGGKTPVPVYSRLAASCEDIDWSRTHITFCDECCVPPEHEFSNYGMVKRKLLDPLSLDMRRVLRMKCELHPVKAALGYEERLRDLAASWGEKTYTHDLILLGMGRDGHTASIFRGTAAQQEKAKWIVSTRKPGTDLDRITMTYPLINAARHICFLVNDPSKENVLEECLKKRSSRPAGQVDPQIGRLTWLVGSSK